MSINHFSTELPEAHWWSHYTMDHSPPAKTSSPYQKPFLSTTTSASAAAFTCLSPPNLYRAFDLNNDDDDDDHAASTTTDYDHEIPKDRLFEKPLTPSDVGKLNRLVIPKQHAEKHFPLNGGGAESGENGLLLGFEDELGKSWRFRYSYWNSSQSYVLTKGWSRFVKEKRLDAGDIVVFARHRTDAGRLFIGWRRRSSVASQDSCGTQLPAPVASGAGWNRMVYSGHPYPIQQQPPSNSSLHFQSDGIHAGTSFQKQTSSSAGSGNSKTLRLFGVNLECQAEESEASTPSPMSSQGEAQQQQQAYHQYQYYSNNHMDISFSGADLYRQG